MRDTIPYFYYDILARIIPGGLWLAVLSFSGFSLAGSQVKSYFTGSEGWKAVVVPFAYVTAAYGLGLLTEILSFSPGVDAITEGLTRVALRRAWRIYDWQNYDASELPPAAENRVRFWAWNRLVFGDNPSAFSHAHRFQAEAKLCYHSLPPLLFVLAIIMRRACGQGWAGQVQWLVLALLLLLVCVWGAYIRERRRWLQVLASVDHCRWREELLDRRTAATGQR